MSRLFISAAHKSSGKTTLTIGLAAALDARGIEVQAFKKGPDYIDPLWLARASRRLVYNLDFNTQAPDEVRGTFAARQIGKPGINLIEGNKGLHDGVATDGSDSSAALAKLLDAPVVLVIDTPGMTRGIAPLLLGYQAFDTKIQIAGIVLNRIASSRHEAKLRASIETYTDIPVLGALPRAPDAIVKERHLGLITPGDAGGPEGRIAAIRQQIEDNLDIDALADIARAARRLPRIKLPTEYTGYPRATIAVARDEAFCFYYTDDLDALERAGAELVYFSPLHDDRLPKADALLIGGGFPETHLAQLQANAPMRQAIGRAAFAGKPIRAECGGLMYLCRTIRYSGQTGEMAGVIKADAVMQDTPQGRGLVVLEPTAGGPPIPAHEFHFARLENLDPDTCFDWIVKRGTGIDGAHDGIRVANTVASFSHFRDTSYCHWAEDFVGFIEKYLKDRKTELR